MKPVEPAAPRTHEGLGEAGFKGVSRRILAGDNAEPCAFHVRYYEVEPGGYTRLERHEHVHSVTVLHGRGRAIVGDEVRTIVPTDHVYVGPMTFHQFINDGAEPFGFLCVVDAQRDRPQPATSRDIAAFEANPATAGKTRT